MNLPKSLEKMRDLIKELSNFPRIFIYSYISEYNICVCGCVFWNFYVSVDNALNHYSILLYMVPNFRIFSLRGKIYFFYSKGMVSLYSVRFCHAPGTVLFAEYALCPIILIIKVLSEHFCYPYLKESLDLRLLRGKDLPIDVQSARIKVQTQPLLQSY